MERIEIWFNVRTDARTSVHEIQWSVIYKTRQKAKVSK